MSDNYYTPMSTIWNGGDRGTLLTLKEIENEAAASTLEAAIKTYGFSLIYYLGQQMGKEQVVSVDEAGRLKINREGRFYDNSDNDVQLTNILFNKIRTGEFARHQIKDWDGVEDYQKWLDRTMDSFIYTMPFSELLSYGVYSPEDRYKLNEIFKFHRRELSVTHAGIGDYSIADIKNVLEKYLTPDVILALIGENVHEDYSDVYNYYTCTKKEDGVEKTLAICPDYHNIHTIYEMDDSNKLSSLGNSYEYLLKTLQIPITTLLDSILFVKNHQMIPKNRPYHLDNRVVEVMKKSKKKEDYIDILTTISSIEDDLRYPSIAYEVNAKSTVNKTIDQHIRDGMSLKRLSEDEKKQEKIASCRRLWVERAIFSQAFQLGKDPKTFKISSNGTIIINFNFFKSESSDDVGSRKDLISRHLFSLFDAWFINLYDRHQFKDLDFAKTTSMSDEDYEFALKKAMESYIGTIPFKQTNDYTPGRPFEDFYYTYTGELIYSVKHSNQEISSRSNDMGLSVADINRVLSEYSIYQTPWYLLSLFGRELHFEKIDDKLFVVCETVEKDQDKNDILHKYAADVEEPILYEVKEDKLVRLGNTFVETAKKIKRPIHHILSLFALRIPGNGIEHIDNVDDLAKRINLSVYSPEVYEEGKNPYVKKLPNQP